MYRKNGENTDDIYENTDIRDTIGKESTQGKSPELTGSDSVKGRSSRAAVVCLVLLCVLLLTAVIVLCVTFTQERQHLISKYTNLTNERDQLRNQLQICVEWTCFQSSFYYMSKEKKNWTESKRYCTERGADLIIINNRNERDFVHNMSGNAVFYIGLTDINVEGNWRWVDGTYLNSSFSFWASGEPNGQTINGPDEDYVVTVAVSKLPELGGLVGWIDVECKSNFQWICEKQISQFILP